MPTMKDPPHPGGTIREDCIEAEGLITEAARALGVTRPTLSPRPQRPRRDLPRDGDPSRERPTPSSGCVSKRDLDQARVNGDPQGRALPAHSRGRRLLGTRVTNHCPAPRVGSQHREAWIRDALDLRGQGASIHPPATTGGRECGGPISNHLNTSSGAASSRRNEVANVHGSLSAPTHGAGEAMGSTHNPGRSNDTTICRDGDP